MVSTDRAGDGEQNPAEYDPVPAGAVPRTSGSMGSSDMQRLERECRRLRQARRSLERLCMELSQELRTAEHRRRHATAQIRLLQSDLERRDREFARARHRGRLMEKRALRQDREFAEVRNRMRRLEQRSSVVAGGFLAIAESRRWRLGHALLSLPARLIGRRPTTVVEGLQPLASMLAKGQTTQFDGPGTTIC